VVKAVVTVLGLVDGIVASLFDLDGVLTNAAAVHNGAWTEVRGEQRFPPARERRCGSAGCRDGERVGEPQEPGGVALH
jgi:beta-phosphoglucomutase-like phosphatase (HAD superfamily)